MEQINPYAVMRNTAVNEAYRAYVREADKSGLPFIVLGILPALLIPVAALLQRHWTHRPATDSTGFLTALVLVLAWSSLCIGLGLMRMAKYRRDHPIPDAWRQIPRISPSPGPVRPSRLP